MEHDPITKVVDLSVIVPVYNEEAVLWELYKHLDPVLEGMKISYEVILVNDGSNDNSQEIIRQIIKQNSNYKGISFSRNFGHQIALSAGLDFTLGRAVVTIDADLQDPPEVIPKLWEKWNQGFEVVCAQRESRQDSAFKRLTAYCFYRILNKLSEVPIQLDTGDFRLLDQKVVNTLRHFKERNRFLRGLFGWTGYKQVIVPFDRQPRFAGKTHYPLMKMVKFAFDGIISFSSVPLRLATWLGIICSLIGFLGIIYVIIIRFLPIYNVSGWAAMMTAILFLGGVQLLIMGMIGEYLSRIYTEVQNRPLYIIREKIGFK